MHDDSREREAKWRRVQDQQEVGRAAMLHRALKLLREDAVRRGDIAEARRVDEMTGDAPVFPPAPRPMNRAQRRAAAKAKAKGMKG